MNMELSHMNQDGKPRMVDVSGKPQEIRKARATGFIHLQSTTLDQIRQGGITKGNVLLTAQIAGIQAAKKTSDLIPLCHPLPITKVEVDTEIQDGGVVVNSEVGCTGQTGVEMEALQAVSTALLTIYDMCKAVDGEMRIEAIRLIEKTKQPVNQEDI
jgi:cyclic pyranopterin phosphate synthase